MQLGTPNSQVSSETLRVDPTNWGSKLYRTGEVKLEGKVDWVKPVGCLKG